MLLSGNGREAVRQACFKVQPGEQLPFAPSIIVLGGGKAEGCEWLGARELLVSPFTGEKTRQDRMIGLADQNELIALFLNNHAAALAQRANQNAPSTITRCTSAGGVAELDQMHHIIPFRPAPIHRLSPPSSRLP